MTEPRYIKACYNGEWAHGTEACKRLLAKADAEIAASGPRRSAIFTPRYVIQADQILANVLLDCHAIRLDVLYKIVQGLRRALPGTSVIVTNHSISCAMEDYPTWFQRVGDSYIGRATGADDKFIESEVDLFFNDQMPDEVELLVKQFFAKETE
jgi:hypothetical protein